MQILTNQCKDGFLPSLTRFEKVQLMYRLWCRNRPLICLCVFFIFFRKSLSEVTACLRERLHRWQQIEKLCGFPVVNNSGLPSLTASLYSDHSWVVMPRVSVPPYPIAGGVDDLDEDTPPIIPQFTSEEASRGF